MEETKKKTGWIFTTVNIVLCMLLIPVILINVTVIVSSYIHPHEIPGVFGIKPVAVLSGSMEDTFMTGDLIFVQKTDTSSLKENDVICYLQDGQAVTHRIVEVEQGEDGTISYITKGDANNTEDRERVNPEQVQGVWNGGRHRELCDVPLQHHRHDRFHRLPDSATDSLGCHPPLAVGQKGKVKSHRTGSGAERAESGAEHAEGFPRGTEAVIT